MTLAAAPAGWEGLRVRIGDETILASDHEAVSAAIGRVNAERATPGLPAMLDPGVIDPVRVRAFLEAVGRLPVAQRKLLEGRSLYLAAPLLPLRATSPTTAASFHGLKALVRPEVQGETVLLGVRMAPDCTLAKAQAAAARMAVSSISADIAKATDSDERAALRRRRARIAVAWNENAHAAADCEPQDALAQKERDAARKAASEYGLP